MVFRYIYYVFSLCLSVSLSLSLSPSLVFGPTIKASDIYHRWAK